MGDDADAVDFDLIGDGSRVLIAAQVKSRSEGKKVHVAEACSIFVRLVKRADAEEYLLLTDALEGSGIADLRAALLDTDIRSALDGLLAGSPRTRTQIASLTDVEVARLSRCKVAVDGRERYQILESLRGPVREYRRGAGLAIGHNSSGLLISCLIAEVLDRAADPHKGGLAAGRSEDDPAASSGRAHRRPRRPRLGRHRRYHSARSRRRARRTDAVDH